MQTIDYILGDYFNKNKDVNTMKNDKLTLLINQISGDGSIKEHKKIIGVSVIGGFNEDNKKEGDGEKKIEDASQIMKQYLEDLKKNQSEESNQKTHTPKRSHTIHKFYSESSVF
jgi:hypothetical protein